MSSAPSSPPCLPLPSGGLQGSRCCTEGDTMRAPERREPLIASFRCRAKSQCARDATVPPFFSLSPPPSSPFFPLSSPARSPRRRRRRRRRLNPRLLNLGNSGINSMITAAEGRSNSCISSVSFFFLVRPYLFPPTHTSHRCHRWAVDMCARAQ